MNFVIHADETEAFDTSAQAAFTQFLHGPSAERYAIQVRMPSTNDGRGFERSRRFASCGVAIDAIQQARFPLEYLHAMQLPETPAPRELLDAIPGCRFLFGSLTIDAIASIQACARHAPDEGLGSFLDEPQRH